MPTRGTLAFLLPRLQGGGGLDRMTANLAAGLRSRGYGVDLVYVNRRHAFPTALPPGVGTVDLEARRAAGALPGLVRYLRRTRPRALIGAMPVANLLALGARWLARVDTAVVIREHNHLDALLDPRHDRKARVLAALMRRWYPSADAVVTVSAGVADDVARWTPVPPSRIEVIFNAVLTASFEERLRRPVEHPWFSDGGPPVVVTIARLSRQKDLPTLLEALRLLREERPVRLMVLGDGPRRSEVEAAVRRLGIEDDVWLPGFVEVPQPYLAHADLFVLSSRYEGFGNVLVEALAAGLPVVATDCPHGPREVLRDGELGRLVAVGDAAALARSMGEALDAGPPTLPADALAPFDLEHTVGRYAELLERLPTRPRRSGARGA